MVRPAKRQTTIMPTENGLRNEPPSHNHACANTDNGAVEAVNSLEEIRRQICQTTIDSYEQPKLESFRYMRLLGLKLSTTPSFLNLVETRLSQEKASLINQTSGRQAGKKVKAANIPALSLQIGDWKLKSSQRASRYEGDLVTKCYYAKRKLVWELLEKGLKKKIEIQWADILAIKANIQENKPGILEVELKQPPLFYHETDPKPKKHTLWRPTTDFTGGRATCYRIQRIEFPPGALDRPYEKLLQFDKQLFQLSKSRFPRTLSPFFFRPKHHSAPFINPSRGQVNLYPDIPQAPVIPYRREELQGGATPPAPRTNDPNASVTAEGIRVVGEWLDWSIDVSRGENASQGHQMISFSNASVQDQIKGKEPVPLATQVNTCVPDQTHDPMPFQTALSNFEHDMLRRIQVGCMDNKYSQSYEALPNLPWQPAGSTSSAGEHWNHGQNRAAESTTLYPDGHPQGINGQLYPDECGVPQAQLLSRVPPQASNEDPMMHQPSSLMNVVHPQPVNGVPPEASIYEYLTTDQSSPLSFLPYVPPYLEEWVEFGSLDAMDEIDSWLS